MFIGQFGGPAPIFKNGAGRFCPNIKKPTKPQYPNNLYLTLNKPCIVRAENFQPPHSAPHYQMIQQGVNMRLNESAFIRTRKGCAVPQNCHPYDFQVVLSTCVVGFFIGKTTHNTASPFLLFGFYAKRGLSRQDKGCF